MTTEYREREAEGVRGNRGRDAERVMEAKSEAERALTQLLSEKWQKERK